jgi:hypothetical protein
VLAPSQQRLDEMKADKLGATHDEHAHDGGSLTYDPDAGGAMAREVTVAWLDNLKVEARVGPHRLLADEPADSGGDDTGPSPSELLLASLGA